MTEFIKSNGKDGLELCFHTASGYQCGANIPVNNNERVGRIMFFARHVVGDDGYPYTEVGLTGLEDSEAPVAMKEIKKALDAHDFQEVTCLAEHHQEEHIYAEYTTHDAESVAVRLNADSDSISTVVDVLGNLILESSKRFVLEQESIPDVLFHSIMTEMGQELSMGPGGQDYAIKKAHDLAETLEKGYWSASA